MTPIETFIPDLPTLERVILQLAARIEMSVGLLPTFGHTEDGARPHLEHDAAGFHFVVVERGEELERRTTRDSDEVLYWVFEAATFSMACRYELHHRIPGQDFRRLLFQTQVELLRRMSGAWAEREEGEHRRVLAEHPFLD